MFPDNLVIDDLSGCRCIIEGEKIAVALLILLTSRIGHI